MKKLLGLLLIIFIATLLGGVYGALHDQLTYTISPEYYTKFKFYQFGFVDVGNEYQPAHTRLLVALVGVMATWWVGAIAGCILALVGLSYSSVIPMIKATLRAFLLMIVIAFLVGLIGLLYGHFYLATLPKENFGGWYIPENLVDFGNFIAVGSMHNFSYLGGLLGLVFAVVYLIRQRKRGGKS